MKFDFDVAIFDMDGTLLDTMPYWRYSGLEFILHHGYPLRLDYVSQMYGESSKSLLKRYSDEEGLNLHMPDVFRELESIMNRHYINDARCKPHVPEFLELLKSRGIRMSVATGTPREYAKNAFERTGLTDYFEFVTDHYETEYTKNSPIFFENLARRLGVLPERCMMFEDALYAIESAKAAGMQVCAIEEGTQASDRAAIQALADVYIQDFGQWLE